MFQMLQIKELSGLFATYISRNIHLCSFLKSQIILVSQFHFWWKGREMVTFLLLWSLICVVLSCCLLCSIEMFMAGAQVQHYLWVC